MSSKVAIVGAGVVGLSVAWQLKEEYGDAVDVTIIAAAFFQGTTSFGSGGFWEPYQIAGTKLPLKISFAFQLTLFLLLGTPDEDINRWGKISFDHFQEEHRKETAAEAGVQMITVYSLFEEHEPLVIPSWSTIVHSFKVLEADDLKAMNLPEKYTKGYTFGSYVADQKYYLQFLMKKLSSVGVKFVQQFVENIHDLRLDFDCTVNCTGLGSFVANEDKEMYPIRGQVLRVK